MNENQLIDNLRGLGGAEPPLGFDPDQVADVAAKQLKRRRAMVAVGGGTAMSLAAIAVSVAVIAPAGGGMADQATPPPEASTTWSTVDKLPRPALANPRADLRSEATRLTGLFHQQLGKLRPGAQLRVEDFKQTEPNSWDRVSGEGYLDAGRGQTRVWAAVSGPINSQVNKSPLAEQCAVVHDPQMTTGPRPTWQKVVPRKGPGRCDRLPQPDGSTVVLEENGQTLIEGNNPDGTPKQKIGKHITVTHFRVDKTQVSFGEGRDLVAEAYTLTDAEMVRLVIDPAWQLK